jgi:hypothetical protein
VLGAPFNSNPNLISFATIQSGSVILNGKIDSSQSPDANSAYGKVGSITPSGGYVGFSLVSSSYVANGFTPSSSSSVNLPLVMGIAIPVGVLVIVVTIVIIVKMRAKANAIKEVQKVDEILVSPENNVNI